MTMQIKRYLALTTLLVAASGCQQQWMDASKSKCDAYGFKRGTQAYAQCVQSEMSRRDEALTELQNTLKTIQTRGY